VDYAKLYGANYYGAGEHTAETISRYNLRNIEPTKRAQAQWSLRRIARHKPAGRLLDVGCSAGVFAASAREAGYAVTAFDVSAVAVQFAREHFGLDAQVTALETANFPAEAFDVITLWDVIEHTEDPWQALRKVTGWLAPGGIIAVRTPNTRCLRVRLCGLTNWDMVSPPEHWQLFSRRSLRLFLSQNGFRVLELQTVHSDRIFYRQTPRWRQAPFWISAACGWGGDLVAIATRQP
jgi:2-polyprenyl-3-methyl-5-hydroxy-6-metoxy-1,4-benzoquinol methylase